EFMAAADQQWLEPPEDLVRDFQLDPSQPHPFAHNTAEADYINARCFTAMRHEMHSQIAARVLLGGRLTGYAGRYPGPAGGAALALQSGLPLYLIGAFGGCTATVIDAIEGRNPPSLTLAEQVRLDDAWRAQLPAPDPGTLPRRPYADRVADFNHRIAASAPETA